MSACAGALNRHTQTQSHTRPSVNKFLSVPVVLLVVVFAQPPNLKRFIIIVVVHFGVSAAHFTLLSFYFTTF